MFNILKNIVPLIFKQIVSKLGLYLGYNFKEYFSLKTFTQYYI